MTDPEVYEKGEGSSIHCLVWAVRSLSFRCSAIASELFDLLRCDRSISPNSIPWDRRGRAAGRGMGSPRPRRRRRRWRWRRRFLKMGKKSVHYRSVSHIHSQLHTALTSETTSLTSAFFISSWFFSISSNFFWCNSFNFRLSSKPRFTIKDRFSFFNLKKG